MSSPNDRAKHNCHLLSTPNVLGPTRCFPSFCLIVCKNVESRLYPLWVHLPQIPEPGSTLGGPSVSSLLPASPHPTCAHCRGHQGSGTEGLEQSADNGDVLTEVPILINARWSQAHFLFAQTFEKILQEASKSPYYSSSS